MRRFTLLLTAVLCLSFSSLTFAARPRVALNTIVPDLNFAGVTLADALDFMRDITGANLHVNWTALEAVGVGRDNIINIRLRNIPMRKVLSLVLSEAGAGDLLAYYVDEDVIEVTTRELADSDLITRIYPVDDLIMEVPDFIGPDLSLQGSSAGSSGSSSGVITGNTSGQNETTNKTRLERAQELIDMIQATIKPDIWQINGGTAAIRFFNGSLIVTAPRSVHEALGGSVD